jgi:hypothetical protein
MAAHTPGPWTVEESCVTDGGWDIPEIPEAMYRDSRFGLEADAKLIAAAPDLLAALAHIVSFYQDPMPVGSSGEAMINAARAALAKARATA